MRATLGELTFDLMTKDGARLEETVIELLQRGASGVQAILKVVEDPSSGERVKRALAKASARVIEAVAALPPKGRTAGGERLLSLADPVVLAAKGYEFLARGHSGLAREFAEILLARPGSQDDGNRLLIACELEAGRLVEAVALARGMAGAARPADRGLLALLLIQGRWFKDASAVMVEAATGDGNEGGDADVEQEGRTDAALTEALIGLVEMIPPGDPAGEGEEALEFWLAKVGGRARALLRAAAAGVLASAEAEGRTDLALVESTLRRAEPLLAGLERASAGLAAGALPDELEPSLASGAETIRELARDLTPVGLAYAAPGPARVDLRALAGAAAAQKPAISLTLAGEDPIDAVGDAEGIAVALRLVLDEASGLAGATQALRASSIRVAGGRAALAIRAAGPSPDFHPVLTGVGAARPVGPARSFRAARAILAGQGGDVHWSPEGGPGVPAGGDGGAQWSVIFALPEAVPAAPPPGPGAGPVSPEETTARIEAALSGRTPGRDFLAAVGLAARAVAGGIAGEAAAVAGQLLGELGDLLDAAGGLAAEAPSGRRPAAYRDLAWRAARARRRIGAGLDYLGLNGGPSPSYCGLAEVVSDALRAVHPLPRESQVRVAFDPPAGLPRVSLDRPRLALALGGLVEEAVLAARSEVRLAVEYRPEEALHVLRLSDDRPGQKDAGRAERSPSDHLELVFAQRAVCEQGGALLVEEGPDGMAVTIRLATSEAERRLVGFFPEYLALTEEARRALKTAEAVAGGEGSADPGLRPFLWRKAVHLELEARLVPRLVRHLLLPATLEAVEGGRGRLSRKGEAALAKVASALPGEDLQVLRTRFLSVAEAVNGDRLERATGDLRSLALLLIAFGHRAARIGPEVARALYALGALPADDPRSVEASREVLAGLAGLYRVAE